MKWKVEEMAIMNAPMNRDGTWRMEYTTPREEKIQFVDEHTDGGMSCLLGVIDAFEKEKDTLKKDRFGFIKSTSLNAWLKKHPCEGINAERTIDFLGMRRYLTQHEHKSYYETYDDIVDEAFHRLLRSLRNEENLYFCEHDERHILCKKVEKHPLAKLYLSALRLGISSCDGIVSENMKPLSVAQLRYIVDAMEKLEKTVNESVAETCVGFSGVKDGDA